MLLLPIGKEAFNRFTGLTVYYFFVVSSISDITLPSALFSSLKIWTGCPSGTVSGIARESLNTAVWTSQSLFISSAGMPSSISFCSISEISAAPTLFRSSLNCYFTSSTCCPACRSRIICFNCSCLYSRILMASLTNSPPHKCLLLSMLLFAHG